MAKKTTIAGNKELIVTEIVSLLTGYITRNECLQIITKKYDLCAKTFDSYWSIANERVKHRQHDTQITIIDNHTNSQLNRARGLIASREELLKVLTKIVRDEVLQVERPSAVVQAISKICEMEGYNKPVVTISKENGTPLVSWLDD